MAKLYVAQPNPAIGGQHHDGSTGARNHGRDVPSGLRLPGVPFCAIDKQSNCIAFFGLK
jgi:hypothetical protein